MRLDKYLAHLQVGSRAEVKQLIRKKQVQVAGQVIKDPGFAVSETMTVTVAGQPVGGAVDVLYIMNKPAGVVSATVDASARTVIDLIAKADRRPGLFPVGRLDKDTTGLLLLTTDGELGHRLLAPRKHVAKTYAVTLATPLTPAMIAQLEAGIALKDFTTQPARVVATGENSALITIHEGKFHQVKRMFLAVGNEVVTLQRVAMGQLTLPPDLALGAYRPLTPQERAQLAE